MAKLYLMRTGQTTFEEQARVESAAGAPLTERGVREVGDAAVQLAACEIDAVYASHGEAERQSAKLLAETLQVKVRAAEGLHEIDYGMWQGLTLEEIKRRQPKVYRHWMEAPTAFCPPGGETMADAEARIIRAVEGIIRRHKGESPLVVLRPVVTGLLICALERRPLEAVWQQAGREQMWCSYDTEACSL